MIVVTEAAKNNNQKKYKCPYCDKRFTRMDLVDHIDKKHQDMIPNGYTSTRVVFNYINKKEHGNCVICGKETEWDEDKARYNRFCGSKKCHDEYVKRAHANTDIANKLRDPEFQQKMLAGRSISGTYKFEDGGKVSYTGSYEKKLLEFLDKFLHVKSYDVQSPGPVIEYEYDGEKHFWITDLYYIPYNLVFDVKDGGDNPNRREMTSYREKQIAKEDAIKKQGRYNYIRLTDNKFEQLIEIMLELKETLNDKPSLSKPVIKINEHSTMTIGALAPFNGHNVYIVDYMKKNTFVKDEHGYALCKDYMQDTVSVHDGIFNTISFEELQEMDSVKVYKYTGDMTYDNILQGCKNSNDLYKKMTGKDLLDSNQFNYDPLFYEVLPYTIELEMAADIIKSSMLSKKSSSLCEGLELPYFELEHLNECNSPIKFYRDIDGTFLMNEETGVRTKSYKDEKFIKKYKSEISYMIS